MPVNVCRHPHPNVEIRHAGKAGVGIFAIRSISKGDTIYEVESILTQCPWKRKAITVVGEVEVSCSKHCNTLECHKRGERHFRRCKPPDGRRHCKWGEFSYFDSLINHSKKPNADYGESTYNATMIRNDGYLLRAPETFSKRIKLVAESDIDVGEQITVDYEDFEDEALGDDD